MSLLSAQDRSDTVFHVSCYYKQWLRFIYRMITNALSQKISNYELSCYAVIPVRIFKCYWFVELGIFKPRQAYQTRPLKLRMFVNPVSQRILCHIQPFFVEMIISFKIICIAQPGYLVKWSNSCVHCPVAISQIFSYKVLAKGVLMCDILVVFNVWSLVKFCWYRAKCRTAFYAHSSVLLKKWRGQVNKFESMVNLFVQNILRSRQLTYAFF